MSDDEWIDQYRAITPRGLKPTLRHLAVSGLSLTTRIDAALRRPRVHVLLLHHIFADEAATFEAFLSRLSRDVEFVSYSRAIDMIHAGPIDRPYVAISFDDGLESCLRAATIMERFAAPGMFFVNPAIVGLPRSSELAQWCRDRIKMPPTPVMTWDDLAGLQSRGHEIGNHTMHHVEMAHPDRPLDEQIDQSRDLLMRRLGANAGRHFAWTYGQFHHMSAEARHRVFASGHESIASGVRGAHVEPCADPIKLCVRRDLFVGGWPLSHNLYFHASTARRAGGADNHWPF